MVRDDFAILILSHGRAGNVKTLHLLEKVNYTGKWYLVIDNEDSQADEYYRIYGKDKVVMFDKIAKAEEIDTMDQKGSRKVILFARNAAFDVAKQLGLKYFLEFDDDYNDLRIRYTEGNSNILRSYYIDDFDYVVEEMLNFLDTSGALTVALAQTGDFIGGTGSMIFKQRIRRKAMNSFFCRTDRPVEFLGRINEDVNMYCLLGSRGELIMTVADISLNQTPTQENSGGMTGAYSDNGTFVKSFYSVMCCPSFVKVAEMGCNNRRYHHNVDWDHGVPKIISSKFRK